MKRNPYSLLFGKEPSQHISRMTEEDQVLSSFTAEVPMQQIFMITGVRGSGKTVFMTEISRKIGQMRDWIVLELNPERNLLQDMASKLTSDHKLSKIFQGAKLNLSFFGLGIDLADVTPITNMETAVRKMLESLKKSGKKILVTIDEAVSTPSMREFAHSFQIFIRADLPVYLLMTGLYQNIDALQNEKGSTLLFRVPKIFLTPLSIRLIAENYKATLHLDEKEATRMAELTGGYSYAFQVLGFLMWEHPERDEAEITTKYKNTLADYAYDKIWAELSKTDRDVARAVAACPEGKVSDIRLRLNMDTNHFNPYRKRLIKKGILDGAQYGYVRFVLPCFAEYVLEN